jgi:hypothetical protein
MQRPSFARIEIAARPDVQMGKAFDDTVSYDYSLDPDNAHNKSIVDLDKTPRNAAGQVTSARSLRACSKR